MQRFSDVIIDICKGLIHAPKAKNRHHWFLWFFRLWHRSQHIIEFLRLRIDEVRHLYELCQCISSAKILAPSCSFVPQETHGTMTLVNNGFDRAVTVNSTGFRYIHSIHSRMSWWAHLELSSYYRRLHNEIWNSQMEVITCISLEQHWTYCGQHYRLLKMHRDQVSRLSRISWCRLIADRSVTISTWCSSRLRKSFVSGAPWPAIRLRVIQYRTPDEVLHWQ